MTLDNLVGKGLREEPTTPEEIQRLLHKASTRLKDSKSEAISRESRFDLAYEAILQLAICALRANGYRPDSRGGHHVIALQSLTKTIQYPREKIRLIDEFRRQRAIGLYDGSFDPTKAEIRSLLETGENLKYHLNDWLRANKPELVES
jgi:hypothetical protein